MGAIVMLSTGEYGEVIRWDHGKQKWYVVTEDGRDVFAAGTEITEVVAEATD